MLVAQIFILKNARGTYVVTTEELTALVHKAHIDKRVQNFA